MRQRRPPRASRAATTALPASSGPRLSSRRASAPASSRVDRPVEACRTRRGWCGRATTSRARATACGDVEHGEVVVLEHHPVREVAPVVGPAAGPHRRLLQRAQARDGLAGVPDERRRGRRPRRTRRVRVATPDRWRSEVQRGALGGEDRGQGPADPGGDGAGRQVGAVGQVPRHDDRGIDLGEGLVHAGPAREHPVGAGGEHGRPRVAGGSSAALRSPSGVRSSARARVTAGLDRMARRVGRPGGHHDLSVLAGARAPARPFHRRVVTAPA